MLNFENCSIPTSNGVNEPRETAKSILENMDAILKELSAELHRIDDAINKPSPLEDRKEDRKEPSDETMLETLNRQRNIAESLLKTAVHIREGLW